MSDSETGSDNGDYSKRKKMKSLFKEGLSRGKNELLKGRIALEHSLGLGHKPNVIPPAEPDTNGPARTVKIGWHPVAGFAGKWFAERTKVGAWITEKVHHYPDPSQHWAVLVGEYCHELWMDERLDIIYVNGRVDREEWRTFRVGETRFNDEALRQAGEMVIYGMRKRKSSYNLISNNCQNFALLMLDAIQIGGAARTNFATTLAVVQTATGSGKIRDLFAEKPLSEQAALMEQTAKDNPIVALAKRLMDEHTTKLDKHHHAR
ncbi:hypothetical protein N657DRAFT_657364 [Parathielavia appendiculata]|uniref:PPPDE domain-containing protein n=1 Tax=Parathielavia appendiculata TaxID=2587402 RepID=A0AAN6Z1F0_9PEZI|nr:hypothetical protein N657DRAFT_657364 [Parathielavia appendiculata]